MRRSFWGGLLPALAVTLFAAAATAHPVIVERTGNTYSVAVCAPVKGMNARCTVHIVTDKDGHPLFTGQPIAGFSPANLLSAYKIPANAGAPSTIIAIVDAYGYPNAESDLAVYRSQWGLPACTTQNGCFGKFNEKGKMKKYPATNGDWDVEQALDLDMASAMCPNCTLYLVEAKTSSFKNLGTAVDTAATLGAHVISNSYCGVESAGVTKFAKYYDHSGVAITAANGDDGYAAGVCAPADFNTVIAVGGTALTTANNTRGWSETVWNGTGSGCSAYISKPVWQTDPSCSTRMVGDTSAVASPSTPVAIYINGEWGTVGGTSVATPLVGGIFGANGGAVNAASTIYANTDDLFDVTTGNNGSCSVAYFCNAEVGYDGPTGWGTPNGLGAY
ncbi:MAG: S8 family serine peptidase [Rhizomicrobium sp.]|jgi:subtilase family serine protease